MPGDAVTPALLHAWLAARSIARGLPPPVADHGGFRVDTEMETETRRWVFPHLTPGLIELARSIDRPRLFIKLCGTADELGAALPPGWHIHPPAWFMRSGGPEVASRLPTGYLIETIHRGAIVEVRILSDEGDCAASGFAAETSDAFVYDRIVTGAGHRRKGLGRAVMAALRQAKSRAASPELLVATHEGRALYTASGWRTLSPYSTASIAEPVD